MLVLLLSVLVNVPVFGQSNTEYSFIRSILPNSLINAGAVDSFTRLSMDCLAANGYGQWTATNNTQTEHPTLRPQNGWVLLGNVINNPKISLSSPPGIVDHKAFENTTYPTHLKATANVAGSVRYVWIGADRNSFIIQGLNDERGPSDLKRQIDIGFSGFPNPPINRRVVKKKIYNYNNDNLVTTGPANPVSNEINWQDEFDIASDKNFLYIVWATNGVQPNSRNIWATAVKLSDGSTVPGFPIPITTDAWNPTVACDVRGDNTEPKFAVASIQQQQLNPVILYSDVVGTAATTSGLIPVYKDPRFPQPPLPPIPQPVPYQVILHARIVRSSVLGQATPKTSVYAIVHWEGESLILHDADNPTALADYVDGYRMTPVASLPLPTPPSIGYSVVDAPIVAFANPYDNQTGQYKQYHVLYQLNNVTINSFVHDPLHIVKYSDNGCFGNGFPPDTRLCLSVPAADTVLDDPTHYVAAVNQMGVHVHWLTEDEEHIYARDLNRTFDEPIEEHTLSTGTCFVTDGTAHGGTVGGLVLPNITLTMWTDPNWGNILSHGTQEMIYQTMMVNKDYYGRLVLKGNNTVLNVGPELPPTAITSAKLVMLPQAEFNFPIAYTGQSIVINPKSICDFYSFGGDAIVSTAPGYIFSRSGWYVTFDETQFKLSPSDDNVGNGLFRLAGTVDQTGKIPARLNLYGSARFITGRNTEFYSNNGVIESFFAPSSLVSWRTAETYTSWLYRYSDGSYLSAPDPGTLLLFGKTTLLNTDIISNEMDIDNEIFEATPIITVFPGYSESVQFVAINSTFENKSINEWMGHTEYDDNGSTEFYARGLSSIFFKGNTANTHINDVFFDNCIFKQFMVEMLNPADAQFTIEDCQFDKIISRAILFRRPTPTTLDINYKKILITANEFKNVQPSNLLYDGTSAIQFENFTKNHVDGYNNRINIQSNIFTTDVTGSYESMDAITLLSSAAAVANNTITGGNINIGVQSIKNFYFDGTFQNSTFICSNTISGCANYGILTDNWFGYSKLNDITSCPIGHSSGEGDAGGILFSKFEDCSGAGLSLDLDAEIDLSGIHSSIENYEAENTFKHNNLDNPSSEYSGGQIEFLGDATGKVILVPYPIPNKFGKNNFIKNGEYDNYIHSLSEIVDIGSINNNFWGYGNSVFDEPPLAPDPEESPFFGLTSYTVDDDEWLLSENNRSTEIECSSGIYEGTKEPIQLVQSTEDTVVNCKNLYGLGNNDRQEGKYQDAYDKHTYYIEKCYAESQSYLAFSKLSAENAARNDDWNRYIEFREFLKKVLYYNPDTLYYCYDVQAILGTMGWFDSTYRTHNNGAIAIRQYIIESGKCPFFDSIYAVAIENLKKGRHQVWKDTVTNPLLTPEDTTIPTLEDLSLGILRGKPVSVSPATLEPRLGELIATRNPFTDILELKYRLDKSTMVRIDVYDLLGRAVYSEGQGYKAEGEHVLSLQSKSWSSGSYYVRLSSPSGEVKTVKVVKE